MDRERGQHFMFDVEHFTNADDAQLQANNEHGHSADDGCDYDAQTAQAEGNQCLNQSGNNRHAEDQPHAADLRRGDRGSHVGR